MKFEHLGGDVPPIGPLSRMRVMTAGIRGARVVEGTLPVAFDDVWSVMGDLEGGFGEFQPDMRRVRVESVHGDRVIALAHSRYGLRARLHGVVRPGWCWLQSRFLLVGMAAEPMAAGSVGTHVALTGGVRIPGRAVLLPGAEPELRDALARLTHRLTGS